MKKKTNYFAAVLTAAMGFGIMTAGTVSAEATPQAETLAYENGASNEYSFRMKEEDRIHDENVRRIKFDFRRDGDRAKYERALREEQKRHDQAVNKIMRDYKSKKPWHH